MWSCAPSPRARPRPTSTRCSAEPIGHPGREVAAFRCYLKAMRRLVLILVLAAPLVSGLAACATAQKLGAANDVHALLVSIRDDDQAAFDAHVDRPALKRQIQGLIETKATKRYG